MPPSPAASFLVSWLLLLPAPLMAWAADPAPPARAPGAKALSADEAFERGLAAYDARRFQEAVEFFEQSYQLSRDPTLLFNLAQSWRLGGDCRRARELYRRFIAEAPQSDDRPRAEEQLRKLSTCGDPVVATPPVIATAPALQPAPSREPPRGSSQRTAAAILAGVGGGLAVAAGLSAWDARNLSDQTTALVRSGRPWDDAADAVDRYGKTAQTRAIVLASTALLAAAVATLLFLRSERGEKTP